MFRSIFAITIIIIGIAGLVLPIIPGIVLIVIGLNLISDEQLGTVLINKAKSKKPFSWIL